ncbi:hypothetical protein RHMOL_Rhmol02G0104100 [Rhododendron molle]|uniref:Uncharacterized protein n=1 Tax=Rhododendron molle TaxID=49168 RepID=A0ACC0PRB7_RHOML|nr:hypothetical protein RHMOL_Rhmol02G0104100 [Rhododendron molle]
MGGFRPNWVSCKWVAAFGILAKDSGGTALLWRFGKVEVRSALVIEAWALRIVCAMASDLSFSVVTFESDPRY